MQVMNPPKVSISGTVKDMKFCDDETAFWQMAAQHSQLHHAYSGSCHPHLGRPMMDSITNMQAQPPDHVQNFDLCPASFHLPALGRSTGKVGGLRGHRWLLMAVESKVVIHDMVSGGAREAVRTLWDGKAPTALAFLYANAARLLGFLAGNNANEVILGPVLAVGHSGGSIALINLTTLQVNAWPLELVCNTCSKGGCAKAYLAELCSICVFIGFIKHWNLCMERRQVSTANAGVCEVDGGAQGRGDGHAAAGQQGAGRSRPLGDSSSGRHSRSLGAVAGNAQQHARAGRHLEGA